MTKSYNLKDKTILITGASDGIGKETARQLALMNARLILHGRNSEKLNLVREEIIAVSSNKHIDVMTADFASLDQVRSFATQVLETYDHLDVLLNNAGLYTRNRQLTTDGFELTFAVNHLAPFLLTHLLLDLVIASAPARIITVSSSAHFDADFDITDLNAEQQFHGWNAYCVSKLANLMFTFALARRLKGSAISVNSLHPGFIRTNILGRHYENQRPVEEGAQTPVYLASAPEVAQISGEYFENKQITPPSALSHNQALQEELWEISERMTGLKV